MADLTRFPNLEALADGRIERGARLDDYIALRAEAREVLRSLDREGWVMVPRRATWQMAAAAVGWREQDSIEGMPNGEADMFERVYRAMLAAAPTAPAQGEANIAAPQEDTSLGTVGASDDDSLEAESGSPAVAAPSERLWLWKNFVDGKPEYWAFDNPYPTHGGGDPITLGEPCGYAIVKPSTKGRTDVSDAEVITAIKRVTQRHDLALIEKGVRAGIEEVIQCYWHGVGPEELSPAEIARRVK